MSCRASASLIAFVTTSFLAHTHYLFHNSLQVIFLPHRFVSGTGVSPAWRKKEAGAQGTLDCSQTKLPHQIGLELGVCDDEGPAGLVTVHRLGLAPIFIPNRVKLRRKSP